MIRQWLTICTILLAFMCQSFVPAGFMPDFDASGKTALVICSGLDAKTIFVANDQNDHQNDQKHRSEKPCSYALGMTADLQAPVLFTTPVDVIAHETEIQFHQFNLEKRRILSLPPRGPPAFV